MAYVYGGKTMSHIFAILNYMLQYLMQGLYKNRLDLV